MYRKYVIILISVVLVSLSSCVSKKKFLEMEAGRLKAEELSRKLDAENNAKAERIKALIADYEEMKNELMESNAMKDQYISELKQEMHTLAQNLNKQTESLQETSFNLDFEKQRLSNALNSKDQSIKSLQAEVSELENEVSEKSSLIDQKNYDIGQLKEQAIVLDGKIKTGESKLAELQKQLDKSKAEAATLKNEMAEKDASIQKLQNQVSLLKKEIGQ
jgi:chromosome segregation ATPase